METKRTTTTLIAKTTREGETNKAKQQHKMDGKRKENCSLRLITYYLGDGLYEVGVQENR